MSKSDKRNVLKQIPDKKGYEKAGYILGIGPVYRNKRSAKTKPKIAQKLNEEERE